MLKTLGIQYLIIIHNCKSIDKNILGKHFRTLM